MKQAGSGKRIVVGRGLNKFIETILEVDRASNIISRDHLGGRSNISNTLRPIFEVDQSKINLSRPS